MGGTAFVFVPLLAGFMVLLYVTAVFASHFVLTIIESTGHGNDEVVWPTEGFTELLWKPFYLGWLGFLTAARGALAGFLAARYIDPLTALVVGPAAFLFLYPVAQLSAFMSSHPWVPFDVEAVGRLVARSGAAMGFVPVVILLIPVVGLGLYLSLTGRYGGPLVGGPLLAVAVYVYARAVGRLLFVVTYEPPAKVTDGEPRRKKRKKPAPPPPPPVEPESLKPVRPKPDWDDEDDTPYAALAAEVQPQPERAAEVAKPKESEMKLLEREVVKPPTKPWGLAVWTTFFGQSKTLGTCGVLALLLAGVLTVLRMLVELNPVRSG